MFRQLKELLSSSIFISAFFLASNLTFAHYNNFINSKKNLLQNDGFAAKHAEDLQHRLGLTDAQISQIENILSDYRNNILNNQDNLFKSNSNDVQQAANNKILQLLDKNQKAVFIQMVKEWWTNINQDTGNINSKR